MKQPLAGDAYVVYKCAHCAHNHHRRVGPLDPKGLIAVAARLVGLAYAQAAGATDIYAFIALEHNGSYGGIAIHETGEMLTGVTCHLGPADPGHHLEWALNETCRHGNPIDGDYPDSGEGVRALLAAGIAQLRRDEERIERLLADVNI